MHDEKYNENESIWNNRNEDKNEKLAWYMNVHANLTKFRCVRSWVCERDDEWQ